MLHLHPKYIKCLKCTNAQWERIRVCGVWAVLLRVIQLQKAKGRGRGRERGREQRWAGGRKGGVRPSMVREGRRELNSWVSNCRAESEEEDGWVTLLCDEVQCKDRRLFGLLPLSVCSLGGNYISESWGFFSLFWCLYCDFIIIIIIIIVIKK